VMAQFIPERRHYFTGNQAFNNSKQSAYDLAKIESKLETQYSSLEKKLESFNKLDRTTEQNAQSIAQINAMLTKRASSAPARSPETVPASSPETVPAPPARTSTDVGDDDYVVVPQPTGPTVAAQSAKVKQAAADARSRQRAILDNTATTAAIRASERARSDVAGMTSQQRMASRQQSIDHIRDVKRNVFPSPADVARDKKAARPIEPPPSANLRPGPRSRSSKKKIERNTPKQVRAGARKDLSLSQRARRALPGLRGRSKYSPAHNPSHSPPDDASAFYTPGRQP
jgi:hypothetical protein